MCASCMLLRVNGVLG